MTTPERDDFHKRKAYAHVRAVIRELTQVQHLDGPHADILRKMYKLEDEIWQLQDHEEDHNYGKFV